MGLFNKTEVKQTFKERLSDVKSIFLQAHTEASNLLEEMRAEVFNKETQITGIRAEIDTINESINESAAFIQTLENSKLV